MTENSVGNLKYYFSLFLILTSCAHSSNMAINEFDPHRCLAQASETASFHLVPKENYGDEVLSLIKEKGKEGVTVLHFNFFTDNKEESYPKMIAASLEALKKESPTTPITIALESQKDSNDPKGIATRNAKTKERFKKSNLPVSDIHGQSRQLQNPPGKEDGVSHTKLIIVGNTVIVGSNNLTKQSTDVGANNEMNLAIQSETIANTLREYVNKIIQSPGEMVDMIVEDGDVRVLTDRLHFNELISQIRKTQAGDTVGFSMYQFLYRDERDVQAKQVFEELLAAHKRGALLQIFLNRAIDLKTQNSEANLRVAELLLQNNVKKVYFDPEGKISHSKFFYRISKNEKVSMISSVNIYRGDFNDNHQITTVIKNGPLTDQLASYFSQQIAYDGTLVSRIPLDPVTKQRYKSVTSSDKTTVWNAPLPPTPMIRFWRGFKQDGLTRNEIEKNINETFISKITEVGGGRGLLAYRPSFYTDNKPTFIPDEIALIAYADAETYTAIRSTKEGSLYGPLHFEKGYFVQTHSDGYKSGSLVGELYQGKVEIVPEGRAYILGNTDTNWQAGVSLRRTLFPKQNLSSAQVQSYLNEIESNMTPLELKGAIILVDPQYLIVMLNARNQKAAQALDVALNSLETESYIKQDHTIFRNQKYKSTQITAGAGISVQFDAKLKSRTELMSSLLNNLKPQFKLVGGRCERIFQ